MLSMLLLASLFMGCSHGIGTACENGLTCSISGSRLCDQTQPKGYCTIQGCSQSTCPSEAVCVKFWPKVDRLSSTYCMRTCDNSSDCRSGYACLSETEFGGAIKGMPQASVLGHPKQRFCAVPASMPNADMGMSMSTGNGGSAGAGGRSESESTMPDAGSHDAGTATNDAATNDAGDAGDAAMTAE